MSGDLEVRATIAKNALSVTFVLAVLLNLADAFWNPSGGIWEAARFVATVLFSAALIAFAVTHIPLRRKGSS
ncbi:hypothetical protein [Streptomyces sp. NPDC054842]